MPLFIPASSNWTLLDTNGAPASSSTTWTYSSPVANVDVINLAGYKDVLLVARGVSASVSGNRCVRVSINNGSSFYSASGDYVGIDNNGVEANSAAFIFHGTATTAARSVAGVIQAIDSTGPKFAIGIGDLSGRDKLFVASTSPINAIRFENAGGGNLSAGSLWVFARR